MSRALPPRKADPAALTTREIEVLRLVVDGLPAKQVATRLGISPGTVEVHLDNIRDKAGVRRVALLARWAVRMGFVPA